MTMTDSRDAAAQRLPPPTATSHSTPLPSSLSIPPVQYT